MTRKIEKQEFLNLINLSKEEYKKYIKQPNAFKEVCFILAGVYEDTETLNNFLKKTYLDFNSSINFYNNNTFFSNSLTYYFHNEIFKRNNNFLNYINENFTDEGLNVLNNLIKNNFYVNTNDIISILKKNYVQGNDGSSNVIFNMLCNKNYNFNEINQIFLINKGIFSPTRNNTLNIKNDYIYKKNRIDDKTLTKKISQLNSDLINYIDLSEVTDQFNLDDIYNFYIHLAMNNKEENLIIKKENISYKLSNYSDKKYNENLIDDLIDNNIINLKNKKDNIGSLFLSLPNETIEYLYIKLMKIKPEIFEQHLIKNNKNKIKIYEMLPNYLKEEYKNYISKENINKALKNQTSKKVKEKITTTVEVKKKRKM